MYRTRLGYSQECLAEKRCRSTGQLWEDSASTCSEHVARQVLSRVSENQGVFAPPSRIGPRNLKYAGTCLSGEVVGALGSFKLATKRRSDVRNACPVTYMDLVTEQ